MLLLVLASPNFSLDDLAAACAATIEQRTVFDLISSSGNFPTLTAFLTAAGLESILSQEGPLTFFAPTESAIAALSDNLLTCFVNDEGSDASLAFFLSYHIVSGRFLTEDLSNGQTLLSRQGDDIPVLIQNNGVVRVGGASIQAPDVQAINGVVHVINSGKCQLQATVCSYTAGD